MANLEAMSGAATNEKEDKWRERKKINRPDC